MYEDHRFALMKLFKDASEANRNLHNAIHYYINEFDTRLEETEVRLGLRREKENPNELPQATETDDDDDPFDF